MNKEFKALSDSTRREILKLLNAKDLTAGEISSHFNMRKPAISKHLEILKNADLVDVERQGQYLYYAINTNAIHNVLGAFLSFFEDAEGRKIYEKEYK